MSAGVESKASSPTKRKPRFALFIATAAGLGYLPKAPGTWGSLAGLLLTFVLFRYHQYGDSFVLFGQFAQTVPYVLLVLPVLLVVALIGVWSSTVTSRFTGIKDPRFVVIDEVSGQMITLLIGAGVTSFDVTQIYDMRMPEWGGHVSWKYLLLGFILFRLFDIWKPFPARQAESLPGGWGIMADDWIAGLYAAIGLWIARAAGL